MSKANSNSRITREGIVTIAFLILLGFAPYFAQWTDHIYLVNLFSRICIYALAALGLNFILGYGGLVSFGHAAFLGIGAYVMGISSFHWFEETTLFGLNTVNQALIVWPLAMIIAAAFAAIIVLISLRTKGVYFIMITLAFAQMLFFLAVSLQPYGGDDGLSLWWGRNVVGTLDISSRFSFFYVCFGLLVVFIFIYWRLIHSKFGQVIKGCMQNETRMRALGYNPLAYQLTAFCIAGATAGLAGALLANLTEFVAPSMMHWSRSGEFLVIVILGGMGTLIGPVVGSAAFFLLEEVLSGYTEYWHLILGLILIVIVLFAKRGIAGLLIGKKHG